MLDHVNIVVSDVARSRAFYDRLLAPLGLRVLDADDEGALYGTKEAVFVIGGGAKPTPVHVSFRAASHAAVDAFHKAGLEAGAGITARRAFGRNMARITMPPSSWIPTATTSRPSVPVKSAIRKVRSGFRINCATNLKAQSEKCGAVFG